MPFVDHVCDALNNWLVPQFGSGLALSYDKDTISALAPKREAMWKRVKDADFLTDDEKRKMVKI
ncbi:MAG: hypothetical protein D3925_14465 [Candidatus Electrothrix sp. AR5]|nr:hypothetical protein [Candidatus Electrothrix sp. AR5]